MGRGGSLVSHSQRVRRFSGLLLTGLSLWVTGCEEPTVVSTVPPGVDQRRALAEEAIKKDDPQAIGESPASPKGQAKVDVIPDLVPALPTAPGEYKTTKSGVKYTTVKEGKGAVAKAGQRVKVHYVGTLDDGREFDSSRRKNEAASFIIGAGKVIKGWDEAVPGMKIGETRKLDIPAAAGYGAQGAGPSPANADLHFEIELLDAV